MKKRRTGREILKYTAMIIVLAFMLFPFYWMLTSSFRPPNELFSVPPRLWIGRLSMDWYREVMQRTMFLTYTKNSIVVSLVTTAICLYMATIGAYSLTRFRYAGRDFTSRVVLLTYMFPRILLLIPLFVTMSRFRIVNTHLSLILAYITFSLPFALWLLRAYFLTIPPDMEQAAMIDGCSKLGAFHRVLLPVALPGITAAGINTFITAWSEYMFAAIFISSEELKTLPPGITSFASQDIVLWGPLMASSVMMTIPALIFCLFAQKYLVSGLMAGSVKG